VQRSKAELLLKRFDLATQLPANVGVKIGERLVE
jgi:hypothetical protein